LTDASPRISTHSSALGPELTRALTDRGFESLTAVQAAVLDPSLEGRDLRITSQTGSGKTVAIGLVVRPFVTQAPPAAGGSRGTSLAHPRAIVVAPTRELAKQVEEELTWLYASTSARVVSVTGGVSVRDERRALGTHPAVVVGTPGRLLDHLRRGAVDGSSVGAVVLDEADRLLDMGFREDLEAILGFVPDGHRTHLVSATFPREVQALANATQDDPVHVEGTRLGVANADIDHVIHLVDPRQRLDALVNLLLAYPDEQTLVFARTRADVATVATELADAGFSAAPISGEMDQPARTRTLASFRKGDLRILVATDVAARGIDVQEIARVVHGEPPGDVDSYTHRSGRTGRAGRKGTSSVLVTPSELPKTIRILSRAGVKHRFEPLPDAETIRRRADERTFASLTKDDEPGTPGFDDRLWALAKRIAGEENPTRAIARLLRAGRFTLATEPRDVRILEPHLPRAYAHAPNARPARPTRFDRADRSVRVDRSPRGDHADRPPRADRVDRPARGEHADRPARADRTSGPVRSDRRPHRDHVEAPPGAPSSWVSFRVSWGSEKRADPRRLLAMVCRRGQIRGTDVGHIRIERNFSIVDVAEHAAGAFARSTAAPDPREPGITIRREAPRPAHPHPRPR
jgi:ATP-dependent RNA helicase DeaD